MEKDAFTIARYYCNLFSIIELVDLIGEFDGLSQEGTINKASEIVLSNTKHCQYISLSNHYLNKRS